jgi:hypothetical protein
MLLGVGVVVRVGHSVLAFGKDIGKPPYCLQ